MALSRFEGRRDAVLNEANVIGTTALRARLFPEPHSTETLKLLREYMQVRLDITQRVPTPEEFSAAVSRSSEIHEALWQQAKAMAAKDSGIVPTGLFIQSLKPVDRRPRETADGLAQPCAECRSARALWGCRGSRGLFRLCRVDWGKRSSHLPMYVMIFLIAAVILLIQHLDRPSTGFITTADDRYRCHHCKIVSGSTVMITTSTVIIYTGVAPRWLPWRGHYRKFLFSTGASSVFTVWVFLISVYVPRDSIRQPSRHPIKRSA